MKAKVRGTEIYFDVDGMGLVPDGDCMVERPVLFLLHGGPGADHSYLKPRMEPLRDTVQLVYVDHRGSGRSARCNPESYSLENNAEDVDALREYLGLERISVFGTSYGGFVSQEYAIRFLERVASLILCATAPSYRILEDTQRMVQERGTPAQVRVCQRLWEGNFESQEQLREYFVAMGQVYSTSFDVEKFDIGWRRGIWNVEQINRWFRGERRTFDFTDRLHNITCPTLVLAGAHDWICSPKHARILAEKIPRAHLKVFPDSGHSIALDEPDAFLAAVRGFLTHAPL